MASTPPENISPPAPPVSFGDLLSSESQSPSSPSIPPIPSTPSTPPIPPVPSVTSPAPPISFGDLIKDIKPEESVVSPPPVPSSPPPVSSNPPARIASQSNAGGQPTTQNPQPISSLPTIPPISPIAQDKLVLLRQIAKQKKAQKKQATLQKIIDLAKTSGKINNQQAQKILHLPQSTLTVYFKELVSRGLLKKEGKGKATYYHL